MKFTPDKLFNEGDGDELLSHLTHELTGPVFSYGFELFKTDLWKFAKVVVERSYCKELTSRDFTPLARAIDAMIEGAWQFLQIRKRYQFDHPALNTEYTRNPFRQSKEHRFINEGEKYSYESPFKGLLNALSRQETRNFTIVIENFFAETGVLEWKRKMKKWLEYANSEESIVCDDWDESPLDTLERLYKLIEAAYLANDFVELQWDRPPNYNLFREDESILEMDPLGICGFNPLTELNGTFSVYNASMLKLQFREWFEYAIHQEKIWDKGEPEDLMKLYTRLAALTEAGWLLTKFDEIPSDWLNPNTFEFFKKPQPEASANFGFISYLTKDECLHLSDTLSFLYKWTSVNCHRNDFKKMLAAALQTKETGFRNSYNFFEKINKIIEVLYLINWEYCKKYTHMP